MSFPSNTTKYIPLVTGLIILLVITLLAPWDQVKDLLQKITPLTFLSLLALSVIYYASKTVRFWYILRLLGIKAPLGTVSLLYLSGQPFSLMPAGELYRTVLLKKYLHISITKSSPTVTIQGLVEAVVLVIFSLVGAFIIGQNRIAIAIVGLLVITAVIALQRGWFANSNSLINKLPFVSLNQSKFEQFIKSHQKVLETKTLLLLLIFSLVPVLSGISMLYISSHAVGFDISYVQSMIGYSLPVIISGLSFLPGGLGISEGGTIGMLQLFGATSAAAITITLLVLIFTLVAGLVYGVIAQSVLHIWKKNS